MIVLYGSNIVGKTKAFYLRKKGKSYREINQQLDIPKSTLSSWFKNQKFSLRIKKSLIKRSRKEINKKIRLMALANREKWRRIHLLYRQSARQQFEKLNSLPSFVPGLMIYWGEGDKKLENSIVRISNIDYRLLKIFINFLINSCKVNSQKIRLWLLLYDDLNESKCKKYWSTRLSIPKNQFIKSQYIKGRTGSRRIHYGVCCVQIYSRELKEKIIEWIKIYFERFQQAGIVERSNVTLPR